MQYTSMGQHIISRLTLGTVQLGTAYGIANPDGKPQQHIAFEVLSTALRCGINTLDTSRSYGTAEQVIGSFLSGNEQDTQPVIVTKFKLNVRSSYGLECIRKEVCDSVQTSLINLKLNRIPILL